MKSKPIELTPAEQPNPPGGTCEAWSFPEKPKVPDPLERSSCCECQTEANSSRNCLETLIESQANAIAKAEKQKPIKAELESILAKANTAAQEYTIKEYEAQIKEWLSLDAKIVELITRLACSVPNWKCIVECYICPVLGDIFDAEHCLGDSNEFFPEHSDTSNLYDLRHWAERNKAIKQRRLQQVVDVLKAWEKPAATINKVLADNGKLIDEIGKSMGNPPDPKVVYDIFFKLVPRHLAIAPPATKKTKTNIDVRYTKFCSFDTPETKDDCCGPNVGRLSIRQRLVGALPYLIEPGQLLDVICCLTTHRYLPAMESFAEAEGILVEFDERIKRERSRVDKGFQNLEANAKARIPTNPPPCECTEPDDHPAHQDSYQPEDD